MSGMRLARHLSWYLAAIVLISSTGLIMFVLQHAWVFLVVAAAIAIGAYGAGDRHGRAGARKASTLLLEDAQRAGQVAELEQLAGRDIEAVIASYRTIQRNYTRPGDGDER